MLPRTLSIGVGDLGSGGPPLQETADELRAVVGTSDPSIVERRQQGGMSFDEIHPAP